MKLNKNLLAIALSSLILLIPDISTANDILLPDMGDSTGTLISPVQEKILGESFFRSIRSQLEISYRSEEHTSELQSR